MAETRSRKLAAGFTHRVVVALSLAAALPAITSSPTPGRAQTQSSQGSSSGWHHFGEQKASRVSDRFEGLERQMYNLINRDRAANRGPAGEILPPLRWSDQVAAVARAHSRDMVAQRYFGHVDPEGRSPGRRLTASGVAWQAAGENIAMDVSVKSAESSFMNEAGGIRNHRSNILSPKFTGVGVGIVAGAGGQLYITQDFMTSPASLKGAFPR